MKGVSKSENRYVYYIFGQSLGFVLPINTTEEPLKVNLINILKNDQIKLLLDKMRAVQTG